MSHFAGEPISGQERREERDGVQQGGPALSLDGLAARKARGPAGARPAGVRHAARGGLRAGQAARDGLRDDHRPRHDRRRAAARRPARRVRLRGADGLVPGRAAGRARALLRHHRRTTTTGCRATTATSRRAPSTCTRTRSPARSRTRSTPSTRRSRRATAAAWPQLFPVWETRNGSRAPRAEHAGGDLHRDARRHRHRRLRRPRRHRHRAHLHRDAARRDARGVPRSPARRGVPRPTATRAAPPSGRTRRWRWRRASLGCGDGDPDRPAPCWRWPSGSSARATSAAGRRAPTSARRRPRLLRAWLESVDLAPGEDELLALLQDEEFSHADLYRRARRAHERRLRDAVQTVVRGGQAGRRLRARRPAASSRPASPRSPTRRRPRSSAREKAKLVQRGDEPIRVALVADGVGGMHGVTHTLEEIRERGVPGFEVEVIGTDPNVDRRLSAVADVDIPFYAGPAGRRAEPPGDRRDARRGPLRAASTSARPAPPASPRR